MYDSFLGFLENHDFPIEDPKQIKQYEKRSDNKKSEARNIQTRGISYFSLLTCQVYPSPSCGKIRDVLIFLFQFFFLSQFLLMLNIWA